MSSRHGKPISEAVAIQAWEEAHPDEDGDPGDWLSHFKQRMAEIHSGNANKPLLEEGVGFDIGDVSA